MSDSKQFSSTDLLAFDDDTTLRWSCREKDVLCWLRIPGVFSVEWQILDLWQCDAGDFVTMTNCIADFPPNFKLHPLEKKGAAARKQGSFSAEYAESIEYVEAPNLWKVRSGDRLLWVGESRPQTRPIDGVLGLVEFREDALVARENNKQFADMNDYLAWSAGVRDEMSDQPEVLARVQHGIKVVNRLGSPRTYSDSRWGID